MNKRRALMLLTLGTLLTGCLEIEETPNQKGETTDKTGGETETKPEEVITDPMYIAEGGTSSDKTAAKASLKKACAVTMGATAIGFATQKASVNIAHSEKGSMDVSDLVAGGLVNEDDSGDSGAGVTLEYTNTMNFVAKNLNFEGAMTGLPQAGQEGYVKDVTSYVDATFDGGVSQVMTFTQMPLLSQSVGDTNGKDLQLTAYKEDDYLYADFSDSALKLIKSFAGDSLSVPAKFKYKCCEDTDVLENEVPNYDTYSEELLAFTTASAIYKTYGSGSFVVSDTLKGDDLAKFVNDNLADDTVSFTCTKTSKLGITVTFDETKGIDAVGIDLNAQLTPVYTTSGDEDAEEADETISAVVSMRIAVTSGDDVTVKKVTAKDSYTDISTMG